MTADNSSGSAYVVTSQRLVGTFFGVSLQTVRDWIQRGAPHKRGRYDLSLIAQWRLKRAADAAAGRNGQPTMSPVDAERHRKLKLANDRAEGLLVDRADAQRELAALLSWLKSQLQDIPQRVVTDLPNRLRHVAKRTTSHQISLCLKKLSAGLPVVDGGKPLNGEDDDCDSRG
jgi:phage terminase Nu1 subunit (DNA packaging protein)